MCGSCEIYTRDWTRVQVDIPVNGQEIDGWNITKTKTFPVIGMFECVKCLMLGKRVILSQSRVCTCMAI